MSQSASGRAATPDHGGCEGVRRGAASGETVEVWAIDRRGNALEDRRGIHAFDGPLDDAPFLAISASIGGAATFNGLKGRIAPAVGPGRPHAGADRSSELGFQIVTTTMAHTESIMAADTADNPIPAAIEAFVAANAEPGTVAIRAF